MYLKKVNWSNIVTKTLSFSEFFQGCKDIFLCSSTWRMFTDCPVWVASKECRLIVWFVLYLKSVHWLSDGVVQWDLRMLNTFFLFWFLKTVYWLSSVSCTQRVLTDYLICVVFEGCSLIHWWYCAMKLKKPLQILCMMVPEESFTDCPYCTVPEEGKLIKYSHQMSPPPKKALWVFLSFPTV